MTDKDSYQPHIEIGGDVKGNVIQGNNNTISRVNIQNSLFTVVKTSTAATRMEFNPNHTADVPLLFFPHPDALLPELTHLIGHRAELQRLLECYDVALRQGRGSLVFVTGQLGYGTKALGRTFVDAIRKGNGKATVTRFWPDEIEKHTRRDRRWKADFEKYANSLNNAPEYLTQAEFAPFWPLIFQVWEKCGWGESDPLPRSPRDIPAYLRQFVVSGKPLVLLLEDFEHASPAWLDLLRYLAPELAQGLPLLLIVTFHAEKRTNEITDEARTPAETLALELAQKNLATLLPLSRVTTADVADYIAPADPNEAERLIHLTDGLPILVQDIWQAWQVPNTLVKDKNGLWQLAPNSDWRTFGTARDYVNHVLQDLWPNDDEAPWPAEKMLAILSLAACEGPAFTPAALALACDVNPAQLIYALEYLLDEPDDPGLLQVDATIELKLEAANWYKTIERRRFSPMLSWYALQAEPPPADLEKLAEALRQTYWPFVERCAESIAHLYQQAGNNAQAAYYRSLIQKDNPLQALMNQAEMLVDGPQNEPTYSRLSSVSIDLYNGGIVFINLLWAQEFYSRIWPLSKQSGWPHFQADCLFFLGDVSYTLGEYSVARAYVERALKMNEELGRKYDIALNLTSLGEVSLSLGEYAVAQEYFERALQIQEELGQEGGIARNLSSLGEVSLSLREYAAARAYFERALQIYQELGRKAGIARNLTSLGEVSLALGEYAAARAYFERALQMDEEVGRKSEIARNLSGLGKVSHALGEHAIAGAYFERALKIFEEIGRKDGIAINLQVLGDVSCELGEYSAARAYFERALKIFEEIERKHWAKVVQKKLAKLSADETQTNHE